MKYLNFIFESALKDLMRNKVRTFLTSLGILIGVASVVLLISFGLGLKTFIQSSFDSLGTNLIYIIPGQIFSRGGGGGFSPAMSPIKFDEQDGINLKKIRTAEYIVPVFMKAIKAEAGAKTEYGNLYATTADIFPVRNLELEIGRSFDKTDVEKRAKVVVVGPAIIDKLFVSSLLALNKNIRLEGQNYKIIGVLKSKGGGGFGGPNFDKFIYMPLKSAYAFNPEKIVSNYILKAPSENAVEQFKGQTIDIMKKRYSVDDFTVADSKEFISTITSIFGILNTVLVAIGAVSLIVGGIGIMNIMYVSVTERIREIGIRRALGAHEKDILYQFLIESVLLSLIGGIMGLLISLFLVYLIRNIFPAYIDLNAVLIAVGTSSFIGIFFGVFPARKAAQLSPMEAIRYE